MFPTEILQVGDRELRITWDDGHTSVYPLELLRVRCPCALCRAEGAQLAAGESSGRPPDPLRVISGPTPEKLDAIEITPVGRYAVNIIWNDGHRTGIYSFEYLRELCPCEDCKSKRRGA